MKKLAIAQGTADILRDLIGTEVKVKALNVTGRITAVFVGDSGPQFRVRYFFNGEAKEPYLYIFDIEEER